MADAIRIKMARMRSSDAEQRRKEGGAMRRATREEGGGKWEVEKGAAIVVHHDLKGDGGPAAYIALLFDPLFLPLMHA
jgi:hypothetical protein